MKFSSFSSVLNFHCMSTQMVPRANNDPYHILGVFFVVFDLSVFTVIYELLCVLTGHCL